MWVVEVLLHGKGLDHLMQPKLLVLSSVMGFIKPLEDMHEALVPLRGVPSLRKKLLPLALAEVERHLLPP